MNILARWLSPLAHIERAERRRWERIPKHMETDMQLTDEDVKKVVPFRRGPAAQAQARFGAIALEQDRSALRYHEVKILIDNYEGDIRQLQQIVRVLKAENEARRG